MIKKTPLPSQDELNALLRYEPETGKLYWRERPREMFASARAFTGWNTKYAGKPALISVDTGGYLHGAIFGKNYSAHRVIWKWMTGYDPDNIDHENGKRADNRWRNLQDTTRVGNGRNQRRHSTNTSGVTGVYWTKRAQKWHALIHVEGRAKSLGCFVDKADAIAARRAAEIQYGYHQNHGTVRPSGA